MSKIKVPGQLSLPFEGDLDKDLAYLKLTHIRQVYSETATKAANKGWSHIQYLVTLIQQEAEYKQDRATERRIRQARFPVLKTLDQFNWSWPDKINRLQVGLGKTHLTTALPTMPA